MKQINGRRILCWLIVFQAACFSFFLCPASRAETPVEYTDTETRHKYITDIQAGYTYSAIRHGESVSGGILDAMLAASWKLDPGRFLIVKYDGGYEKKLDFWTDENGQRPRTEFQEHTLTPMLHWEIGHRGNLALVPSLLYTATLNKDTAQTDWNDGLYNYQDIGAGLDLKVYRAGLVQGKGQLTIGLQYYKRHYPNFSSLLDLAVEDEDLGWITNLDTEKDEKDYGGLVTKIDWLWAASSAFSIQATYTLLYKQLDDKKVVNGNGLLSGTRQKDQLHTLTLYPRYSDSPSWEFGIRLETGLADSNQNFYDGMETYTIADDVATEDYYDYITYQIKPGLRFQADAVPLTLAAAYTFQRTRYADRWARTEIGRYKPDKQRDTRHTVSFRIGYRLYRNWDLFAGWDWTRNASNNDDQRYYRYAYTLDVFSLGAAFHY